MMSMLEESFTFPLAGLFLAEGAVVKAVNSDAHSVHDFDNLAFGVGQARRGWLEKSHVLNTRPLAEVRTMLAAARRARVR